RGCRWTCSGRSSSSPAGGTTGRRSVRSSRCTRAAASAAAAASSGVPLATTPTGGRRRGRRRPTTAAGVTPATTTGAARCRPGPTREHLGELAVPLLEAATRAHPDDVAAWEWLGAARRYTDRPKPALAAYEAALALAPGRERTLAEAGMAAGQLGLTDDAVGY